MTKLLLTLCGLLATTTVLADSWRTGNITNLTTGYDGTTITFKLNNISSGPAIDYSKCTCYSSWQKLCLDPTRATYEAELSMLLTAYTANKQVNLIFADDSCYIKAFGIPE